MSVLRLFLLVSLLALSTFVSSARAEWLKGESEHFVVYGDTSERQMRAYVQRLERFDQVLRAHFPTTSDVIPPKLPIYLAKSKADMRSVWPTIPSQVGGFYTRQEERIFAVVGDDGDGDTTLYHEYAHHFLFQNFTRSYPSWFIEGFAEYFATADLKSPQVKVGMFSPGRMNSLTIGANSWAPMMAILAPGDTRGRRAAGHQFYAQSWALTHYMLSTPERQGMLAEYLRSVGSGVAPEQGIQDATGRTPEQLQTDLQGYIAGRINVLTLQRDFPVAEVSVEPMTAVERDAMWLDLRLARFVPEALRSGNLQEARLLAAKHAGEPLAARVLAQAYLDMQQPTDAVETLKPIVESHPEDAQSLRMLAVALMDEGDTLKDDPEARTALYNQARSHLAKGFQVDPGDWRIYLAIDRSRQMASGYPNANDLEVLRAAKDLAPQLPSVRIRAASALMHHQLFDEAIQLLEPVAADPHGGSGFRPAREILSRAYAAVGRTPPAGFVSVEEAGASETDDAAAED